MAVTQAGQGGYLERPRPSGLADVIDIILDKGLVIDAYVRVSLIGIEILTIDARIVVASVDTYLRFAEATNRLDLYEHGGKDLSEMVNELQEGGASRKTSGAIEGVKRALSPSRRSDEDEDEEESDDRRRRDGERSERRRSTRTSTSSRRRAGSR